LQAMSSAIERRDATPPPDLTRYKLLEIERIELTVKRSLCIECVESESSVTRIHPAGHAWRF